MIETSRHIPALTGLRAVAAGLVFFGHILAPHAASLPIVVGYGWAGVDIFFALSGYLFTWLYTDALLEKRFSWSAYLKRRLIRIYPLTTLVVVVASLSCWASITIPNILSHLTLVHGWFPAYRLRINAPMWTLSIEESYYLVAPLLILVLGLIERSILPYSSSARSRMLYTLRTIAVACTFWFLSVALCRGLSAYYQDILYYATSLWDERSVTYTIFGRLNDFVAGMLGAMMMRRLSLKGRAIGDVLFLGGCLLFVMVSMFIDAQGGQDLVGTHKLGSMILRSFAVCATLLMMGLHHGGIASRILSSRLAILLGECSFALYLIQFIPLGTSINIGNDLQLFLESQSIHYLPASVISYGILNLVAYAVFRYFERPISRMLRKRFMVGSSH